MSSKQMTVGNRSAMFGHLAAFLPCSKDTLMKRAKTLRVKDLEDKIKEPMEKLKQGNSVKLFILKVIGPSYDLFFFLYNPSDAH